MSESYLGLLTPPRSLALACTTSPSHNFPIEPCLFQPPPDAAGPYATAQQLYLTNNRTDRDVTPLMAQSCSTGHLVIRSCSWHLVPMDWDPIPKKPSDNFTLHHSHPKGPPEPKNGFPCVRDTLLLQKRHPRKACLAFSENLKSGTKSGPHQGIHIVGHKIPPCLNLIGHTGVEQN